MFTTVSLRMYRGRTNSRSHTRTRSASVLTDSSGVINRMRTYYHDYRTESYSCLDNHQMWVRYIGTPESNIGRYGTRSQSAEDRL